MADILEEREKRRVQILTAFGEVIRALEHDGVIGPGGIKLSEWKMGRNELIISLKVEDRFTWEEILHDGT